MPVKLPQRLRHQSPQLWKLAPQGTDVQTDSIGNFNLSFSQSALYLLFCFRIMDRFFNCFAVNDNSSAKGATVRLPLGQRSDSMDGSDKVVIDMGTSSSPPANKGFRNSSARSFFDCFSEERSRHETPDKGQRYAAADREFSGSDVSKMDSKMSTSPGKHVAIEINQSPSPPHVRRPQKQESFSSATETLADIKNRTPTLIQSKKVSYNRLYCQEYSEEYTTVQFLMKVPLGTRPGQVIVNIGGRPDCSIKLPDYIYPGETVVLIARGGQKRVVSGASSASTATCATDGSIPTGRSSTSNVRQVEEV